MFDKSIYLTPLLEYTYKKTCQLNLSENISLYLFCDSRGEIIRASVYGVAEYFNFYQDELASFAQIIEDHNIEEALLVASKFFITTNGSAPRLLNPLLELLLLIYNEHVNGSCIKNASGTEYSKNTLLCRCFNRTYQLIANNIQQSLNEKFPDISESMILRRVAEDESASTGCGSCLNEIKDVYEKELCHYTKKYYVANKKSIKDINDRYIKINGKSQAHVLHEISQDLYAVEGGSADLGHFFSHYKIERLQGVTFKLTFIKGKQVDDIVQTELILLAFKDYLLSKYNVEFFIEF